MCFKRTTSESFVHVSHLKITCKMPSSCHSLHFEMLKCRDFHLLRIMNAKQLRLCYRLFTFCLQKCRTSRNGYVDKDRKEVKDIN